MLPLGVTPGRRRRLPLAALGLLALTLGCLPDITLPTCERDSDCDAVAGYCACREGYCFRAGCAALVGTLAPCAGEQQEACCRFDASDPDCAPSASPIVSGTSSPAAQAEGLSAYTTHGATGGEVVVVDDGARVVARAPLAELPADRAAWPVRVGPRRWLVATPAPTRVALSDDRSGALETTALAAPESGQLASALAVFPDGAAIGLSDSARLWRFSADGTSSAMATPLEPATFRGATSGGEANAAGGEDNAAEVFAYGADVAVLRQGERLWALDVTGGVLLDAEGVGSSPVAARQVRPTGAAILTAGLNTELQVFRPIGAEWSRESIDVSVRYAEFVVRSPNTLVGLVAGDEPAVVAVNFDAEPATRTWTLPLSGTASRSLSVFGTESVAVFSPGQGLSVYRLGTDTPAHSLTVTGSFGAPPAQLPDGTLLWLGDDGRLRRMLGASDPVSHDWPYAGGQPGLGNWLGGTSSQ